MTRTVPNLFAAQTSPQEVNLDLDFSALTPAVVLPCTATGTNSYSLTPQSSTLTVTAYSDKEQYSFIAPNTSTGVCTITIGSLAQVPLYMSDGATQATAGNIVGGKLYQIAYTAGSGGFIIVSASVNGVVVGTYSNATVTVGADGRVTGISGGSPGVGSGFFKSLRINNNPSVANTQINVSAAVIIAATSSFQNSVALTNLSATIDLTAGTVTSQANGMDGEARSPNAPVYIYAISTASGAAGLGSLSSLVPTLPPGVTQFTRIGAIALDSSSNAYRTLQFGRRTAFTVTSGTNTNALPILVTGALGSYTTPTYVAISLASYIPATAVTVYGSAGANNGATLLAPNANYGPDGSLLNPPPVDTDLGDNWRSPFSMTLESTNIYYANSGNGIVMLTGWDDNLP